MKDRYQRCISTLLAMVFLGCVTLVILVASLGIMAEIQKAAAEWGAKGVAR